MAESSLSYPAAYFPDPRKGKPIFNGQIFIGAPDLDPEIEANRVDVIVIQENGTRVTIAPAGQPILTGAGGVILYQGSTVVVRVTDTVSIKVLDSSGTQTDYFPRFNEDTSTSAAQNEGSVPVNGSFENDASGAPDNWTISVGAGSIVVDTNESSHGLKSLNITGIGVDGGGTAASDKFNVLEGSEIDVRFSYRSTAANTLNEVSVRYYSILGAPVSTVVLMSDGMTNPAVYTSFLLRNTVPAGAVQADILLDGVKDTGVTTIASTFFDGVYVDYMTGNFAVGKDGRVLEVVDVANSVNKLQVTNAITGQKPKIDQVGDDVGIDIEGVELKNGVVTGDVVGNLSGASTASIDTVTADTLDGDLNFVSNGVGDVTVNSIPIYGMVVLDTPEVLVNASSITSTWTAEVSATLVAAGARKAILSTYIQCSGAIISSIDSYARKTGSALPADASTLIASAKDRDTDSLEFPNTFASGINTYPINLDSSFSFDWQTILNTGSNPATTIVLVGYYV